MSVKVFFLTAAAATLLVSTAATAVANDQAGWGFTLRGGAGFQAEDLDANNRDTIAAVINVQMLYNLGSPNGDVSNLYGKMLHDWNMGVNFDYEHYSIGGAKGYTSVISILPFIEFGTRYEHWRPYATFGVGYNYNASHKEPKGTNIDIKNSVAFKVGVGTDYYLTKNLALNLEAAYKGNDTNGNLQINGAPSSTKFDSPLSNVQTVFGIRYFY